MKTFAVLTTAIVLNSLAGLPLARAGAPGAPEANGLTPRSATIYVNPGDTTINNNALGSVGVAIANNGNVIIGWSDGVLRLPPPLSPRDLQRGVWTLYDINGNSLTPTQMLVSVAPPTAISPATLESKFLALYRSDGSLTPGNVMEMVKVKANLFGPGIGFGGTTDYALLELPELASINLDDSGPDPLFGLTANSFAIVQLLNNDGSKGANVLSGFTDADAQPNGGARIGDWEFLSNGNILIVTENRQPDDLTLRFGGAAAGQHVVFRIVKPDGTEVKGLTLASADAVPNGMWHGAGVTSGRFALRFDQGGAKVRIFNNDGSPVTGNIDLGALTGNPLIAQGGRGDEAGFHGNGVDAYVNVNSAVDTADGIRKAWITVLNHSGSLRYSRVVTDDADMLATSRVDGAIDGSGRAIAVYEDAGGASAKIIRGRLFSRTGAPAGGTFYVSEIETPTAAVATSERPRVAWRGDKVAVVWESLNNPNGAGTKHLAARFFGVPALVSPEDGGLVPQSPTFYANTAATINNGHTESLGVAIANNGNVIVGWEDDGSELSDLEAVWTMYDPAGTQITSSRTISTLDPTKTPPTLDTSFLAFFRSDGTPVSGWTAWGPKIKANPFGSGVGMGATAFALGLEVPELADINVQPDGSAGDFPAVQLLNNDGTPLNPQIVPGYSDTDADVTGDVRIGDWDYLSDGNIVVVGESRQQADLVDRFGGPAGGNHAAFRILGRDGTEIKALSLVGDSAVANEIWHGVGVTRGGFAVRFGQGGAQVRVFRNDGSPVTENINMAFLTGNPAVSDGGRGDSTGFHGNGSDAYVMANSGIDPVDQIRKAWVTVLNANGTLRYSRAVSDDVPLIGADRVDAAIDSNGRVLVVYDDAAGTANNVRIVRGRLFNPDGSAAGGTFYVSELETPSTIALESRRARVAMRNGHAAIVWESSSHPTTPTRLVAGRIFSLPTSQAPEDNGLSPSSPTFYVNTSTTLNNGHTESLGVTIANNGNIAVGWEDDGSELSDLEAVWTLYNRNGQSITAPQTITSLDPTKNPPTLTTPFLSFFRSDGTPISGWTAWGPKMHANLFGNGMGMGATAFAIGLEIPELADINVQPDGSAGDFPVVQLLNNDGAPFNSVVLPGYSDTDADVTGDVRIGDWEYLSNGNIVIVGESRQQADLVDRFGGPAGGNHAAFRILRPDGTEVKALSLVSDSAVPNEIWHGVGVTRGGFAVRFGQSGAKIRLFHNDGTPASENIDVTLLTGNPAVADGGRGDSTGFHGNGNDAYVLINSGVDSGDGVRKAWVTVINADGTLRYSRPVSDDIPLAGADRTDGGIDALGRVVAVYDDAAGTANNVRVVRGRLFNANGSAAGGTFYVSELETPATLTVESRRPRAAFRGNQVAVVWESSSHPTTPSRVVTGRFFTVPGPAATLLTISEAGADVKVEWSGGGSLQGASDLNGPWATISGAASPFTTPANGALRFFRVR